MPEKKVTFCRICEASCGLVAEVEGERVLRLAPDPEHVLSRGFACVKGIRYAELHNSPDRLTQPLKRVDGRFVTIGWDQALSEIGEKLRDLRAAHGNDALGVYIGNPAAFSPAHVVFAGAFAYGAGTRHIYTSGSQDCNNKFVASEEVFGNPLLQPIPDLDGLNCFIVVGANPAISQLTFVHAPRLVERLKAREQAGARIFFVNPRHTESAQQVGEQVFIRPGSDVYFLLAFAQRVVARGALDAASLARAEGLSDFCALVAPWTPEVVAARTGIAPSTLEAMVDAYCRAEGAALYAGTGVNQGPHGTLCQWLMHAINLVSGNLRRPGGMIVTRATMRAAKVGYPSADKIEHRHARFGELRSVLDSLPAGVMPDEILTPGPGQLRALFVTAGNPVLSCPNGARMKQALASLDLLVSIDLFRNETGNLAHYVLPVTSFLERGDVPMGMSGYQPEPYGQWVDPVVPPRGEAKDEWWIFARLAEAAGVSLRGSRAFQWLLDHSTGARSLFPRPLRFDPRWLAHATAWLNGTSMRALKKRPHGLRLERPDPAVFLKSGILTKSGKAQLAPERFVAALAQLDREAQEDTGRPSLQLITKRERTSHNSWMHNVGAFVQGPRSTNYLYMHPDDAVARGLSDGQLCAVRSSTGAVEVPVRLSQDLMPGTVALPHGWGHAEADGLAIASRTRGVNANLLAADGPGAVEPLSGMARLTAIAVEVSPLEA